jgi:hypothetical protein
MRFAIAQHRLAMAVQHVSSPLPVSRRGHSTCPQEQDHIGSADG